jgi:predicted DNA binding CopG/RHH family protein
MSNFEINEQELMKDFALGKLVSSDSSVQERKIAKEAADRFLRKDSRINIRLSSFDLALLKRKAAEEGLPYQSLVSSILHKYATGRLGRASEDKVDKNT